MAVRSHASRGYYGRDSILLRALHLEIEETFMSSKSIENSMALDTLVGRFWKNVMNYPTDPAFYLKRSWNQMLSNSGFTAEDQRRFYYRRLTWKESGTIVMSIALHMEKELGVKKGDRVAILSWSRAEWIWHCLAAWSVGAIVVGIDPRYGAERVGYILNDSDVCDALPGTSTRVVYCEDMEQMAKVLKGDIGNEHLQSVLITDFAKRLPVVSGEVRSPFASVSYEIDAELALTDLSKRLGAVTHEAIAMLLYTSGSTGNPKGVIISHANIASMCSLISERVSLTTDDRFLGQLPLSHIFIWNGLGPCLWNRVPVLLCSPFEMEEHLGRFLPTILFGVPKVWNLIKEKIEAKLNRHPLLKQYAQTPDRNLVCYLANQIVTAMLRLRFRGLRLRVSGGAALPKDLDAFFKLFEQDLMNGYGSTETTGCVAVETDEFQCEGSVGKLLRTVDYDFEAVPGEEVDGVEKGVLWVGGPTIASGYWNDPEKTRKAFENGRFRTGDFCLVQNGFVFIGDREDDVGKLENGEKVSGKEIIDAFAASRLIAHCVPVFKGLPRVKAIVFLGPVAARKLLPEDAGHVDAAEIGSHPAVIEAVLAEIKLVNSTFVAHGEWWKPIREFVIVSDVVPSTENGLISMKNEIVTKAVVERYGHLLDTSAVQV
jgi:long-chain acyl-CoA synthetase